MRWRDKPREEQQADLNRYRATRQAAEQAARALRDECPATAELNSAVIEAEREVPWWRRS